MRRLHSIIGSIGAANTAFFSALAATTAGVPLTLAQSVMPTITGQLDPVANPITFTSAGNQSTTNFTIVGTNREGQPYTEIVAGPNANTVQSHGLFATITSITPSATNAATVSAGYGALNYGPWLYTGQQNISIIARIITVAPTFTVQGTNQNLLDANYFLAGGDGNIPYSYNLVPASLQAACPQLLGTTQILPEDDGTWSAAAGLAVTSFTTATPGTVTNTADYQRSDPILATAVRLVMNSGTGLVELDVQIQKPW